MYDPLLGRTLTMDSKAGEVEIRNILEILRDALNEYDNWIKTHNPEKEIFQYEINP
jgi:hypothetical protein